MKIFFLFKKQASCIKNKQYLLHTVMIKFIQKAKMYFRELLNMQKNDPNWTASNTTVLTVKENFDSYIVHM
jgi:hypothetical protein